MQPDSLPPAKSCIHYLLIERMAKRIVHRHRTIGPLRHPCLHDELPTASELLTLGLDSCQRLLAPRSYLDRREAHPIDTPHLEQLLVFDSQGFKLFGDQVLQILG